MTGHAKAIIVTFDEDLSSDYVRRIIDAIQLHKHVVDVRPLSTQPDDQANRARLKSEIASDVSRLVDRLLGFDMLTT